MALSAADYIELLPARWQAINAYGVKLNHRTYDSVDLNPFRRQPSGVRAKKNRWEVHHDPYDVSRIWVRNHWDGGWIMCYWKHLHRVPVPFGELAWNHARQELADQGEQPTETAIADAVAALFATASRGPVPVGDPQRKPSKTAQSKRRRVVARTQATAPARPEPAAAGLRDAESAGRPRQRTRADPPVPVLPSDDPGTEPDDAGSAEVVPLPIFNAREEAARWR